MEPPMPAPIFVRPLSDDEVAVLRRTERTTRDAAVRLRCLFLLRSAEGLSPRAIGRLLGRSPDTVRRALRRYERGGLAALADRPSTGRPRRLSAAWEARLLEAVEQHPRAVGVDRAGWTARALAAYLARTTGEAADEDTVASYLRRHGYRPRARRGR
jgi:transposase